MSASRPAPEQLRALLDPRLQGVADFEIRVALDLSYEVVLTPDLQVVETRLN